ncbi:DUF3060 domain-containing protein [Mycobacterium sp. E3198]|uniref:DUF3060 domain-containing protein n=1 Tax=Mycobacterium sp. E3198 TaxID=1834143 RepID=UPI000800D671|nr:DUF3060 domain-containing protein [Mycobacterium sp. E3198]OBG28081.1 hypothetical protein A5673_05705 [Mycobacterium sp. E3198]
MDSDDPEKRIRELERRLADAKGGPRENVPAAGEVGPVPDAWVPPPSSVNPPNYELLRRQMNRRRRLSSMWGILLVPGILLVAILVFHPYRVEKHAPPATTLPGAEPTADLSGALTVAPGGNLTQEPSSATFTVFCDRAELTIGGNGNSAYVAGHCAHLIVKGSGNKVVADNADAIDTDGSANQVTYHSGAPQISVGGTDNIVRKG